MQYTHGYVVRESGIMPVTDRMTVSNLFNNWIGTVVGGGGAGPKFEPHGGGSNFGTLTD